MALRHLLTVILMLFALVASAAPGFPPPIQRNKMTTNVTVTAGANVLFTQITPSNLVISASGSTNGTTNGAQFFMAGTNIVFNTNGNGNLFINVGQTVWTNDGAFVYLRNTGTNHPGLGGPGPAIVIRTDGSIFIGTNVALEVSETDRTISFPIYAAQYLSSNQPASSTFQIANADSPDYNYFGQLVLTTRANPTNPLANLQMVVADTNGQTRSLQFNFQTFGTLSFLSYSTNGGEQWGIADNGDMRTIKGVGYSWPIAHGIANSVLTDTNGSGVLTWTHVAITNVSGGFIAGTNAFLQTNGAGQIVFNVNTNNLPFSGTNGFVATNRAVNTTAPLNGGGTLNIDRTLGIAIGPGTNTTFSTNAGAVTVGALPQTPWLQTENMAAFSGTNGFEMQVTNDVSVTVAGGGGVMLTNTRVRLYDSSGSNVWAYVTNGQLWLEAPLVKATNNLTIQQLGTNSATDVFDTYSQPGNNTVSISSTGSVVMSGSTNRSLQNVQPATLSVYGDGQGDTYSSPGALEVYGTNNLRLFTVSQFVLRTNASYPYLYFFGATGGEALENFATFNFLGHAAGGTREGYESFALDGTAKYFVHSINGDNGKIPYMDFSTANAIIDKPHLQASQGSAQFPGITFNASTNYGFYRLGGEKAIMVAANGFAVGMFFDNGSQGVTPGQPGFWLTNRYMIGFSTNIPTSLNPNHVRGPAIYYYDDLTLGITNSANVASNLVVGGSGDNPAGNGGIAGGGLILNTNLPPPAPLQPGQCFFWNSNATIYLLTSDPAGLAWTHTNKLAP